MADNVSDLDKKGHVKIDWGRQGGVILAYIVVFLGYFGLIANTIMLDDFDDWLHNTEMNPSVLFWTYKIYSTSLFEPNLFILILIILSSLIIFFSIKKWHSFPILMVLIPIFLIFTLDLYWNLINIFTVIASGALYINIQGLAVLLLFFVCFALTYTEDIPYYGIKASIWLVPFLIVEAFVFHLLIFGFSFEPFLLQFGRLEGYVNIFMLIIITLSGSNLGKRMKIYVTERKKTEKVI